MTASTALFEAARAAKLARPQAVRKPAAIRHGTQYAYQHRLCRCDVCMEAMRVVWRQRNKTAVVRSPRKGMPPTSKVIECERCRKPFHVDADSQRRFCGKQCGVATVAPTPIAPTPDPNRHAHHWLLGEPSGPISLARCRDCGEVKQFGNSPDAADELKGRQGVRLK